MCFKLHQLLICDQWCPISQVQTGVGLVLLHSEGPVEGSVLLLNIPTAAAVPLNLLNKCDHIHVDSVFCSFHPSVKIDKDRRLVILDEEHEVI